jgi:membrane protein implicated in regulation of membrane protease activity
MTAMMATLAKFYPVTLRWNWLLTAAVLLAAVIVSALIFWRALKKRE